MTKFVTVNLFLIDGTADGRIKCTINNRNGILFKIPRKDLTKYTGRAEWNYNGVYFLLGQENDRPTIYIGQVGNCRNAKGILNRLSEHDRDTDKNFWTDAIIITTSDNAFGPTEISRLERKFCDMVMTAAQYDLKNGNDPSPVNITEEKESELVEQVEFAKLILGVLGYKIFEPPQKISEPPVEEIFYLKHNIRKIGKTIHAQMKRTSDGYVVLTGSEISSLDDSNLSANIRKIRRTAKIDTNGNLLEDVKFSNSSTAAKFVLAMPVYGDQEWKTFEGVPLKKFLQGDSD